MEPAVLVLLVIIGISASVVVLVFVYGIRTDGDFHGGPADSTAVNFWTQRAEKMQARQQISAVTETAGEAGTSAEDEEAEKARKRAEALARKAARQAKS
jgi:hypothetical protein